MENHTDFVHLHCYTQYSLLESTSKVKELTKRAAELKFPALAMTDQGNLFGAIWFYDYAMKNGIKPIIGLDAYVAPKSRFDRTAHGVKDASFRLTLLAKNEAGYRNLMKLSSASYLEGFYYKPRIDKELLKKHSEGLVALSGPLKGEVPYYVWNEQLEESKRALRDYLDIFGKKDFYLEVMDHGLDQQRRVTQVFREFGKEFDLKLVATNDCRYIHQTDAPFHDALICIGTGSTLSEEDRVRFHGDQYYLKSAEEMQKLFKDLPDALKTTLEIAEKCNLELDFSKTHLPVFKPPKGKTQQSYIKELCFKLLREQLGTAIPSAYEERLTFELNLIEKMGFTSYFLIVWDFIRFAKEANIPVGPGRGSAAGALVAYALGITDLDPIAHGLIFERFLNPDRISMPDIDIDFCYERRGEVIEYVRQKYGNESVAQIITFGTMAARAAIRDVGRVMSISYQEVDRLAKLIPMELDVTIDKALKVEPKLKDAAKKDETIGRLIETSKALEGLSRHASTHAAGVVISDGPLSDYCPLFKADNEITTQFDMKAVEKIGLLKMDFLGLRTLTVVDRACQLVAEKQKKKIDIHALPLDDQKTYDILGRGEAIGVFQLESSGMRDLLRKMKPSRFGDIVALLALYRPGPLGSGMVDDFIKRMHNPKLIQYDHPALESILKETYGIILYQEQVMQIVSALAGFSLAKADSLRRAMGKKIPEIMEREKQSFIKGATDRGVQPHIAEKIWNLIEYFSGYGFNKSHSTAYAYISYQTAYLKANYPVEFMTALLTSEKDNTDKIVRYIDESKRLGIVVEPPSVNASFAEFTAEGNTISFGLSAVKNVGTSAVESIIATRKADGTFKSPFDFVERVDLRLCNRKVLESLIKCGAFDIFELRRASMFEVVDQLLEHGARVQKDRAKGQLSLLDHLGADDLTKTGLAFPDTEEWPENQLLAYEREMLGFYVSTHPLARYEKLLGTYGTTAAASMHEISDQSYASIGGIINSIKEIITKKGDKMGFVALEDLTGNCEVVVFPDLYKTASGLLVKDKLVFINGRVNSREDTAKMIAEEIIPLEEVREKKTKCISIDLLTAGLDMALLNQLRDVLQQHRGQVPVYLSFRDTSGRSTVLDSGESYKVDTSDQLFEELERLLGQNMVKIRC
ncbi:MAG: DNA polymerase III subunit alpha [Candidatus Omnitrophica bacterium CG11_big_fil_rev_8_21_14_0_20_45_26]|uniref:DNA polymerase III subunit alpha n=1 Tax=Candidatus Abzuiibacterium crystallinum TaxID=1974748 RepID=A0A2H0LQS7_9BACT|nr:MAG: DNA polymerase III subunit alpha [Candidatus Omnitrophica bacterium CG11_big_fil_rev_8_21_14_0_20_45_26]PIW65649.1 MAG: DNA polymerase III subunit alpha [Candidatus Omnitrophica bacterium CG12_big_fil_rev_8_21_14_0_65_45_16]